MHMYIYTRHTYACTCEYVHMCIHVNIYTYMHNTHTRVDTHSNFGHIQVCARGGRAGSYITRTEEINDNFMLNKAFSFHREAHTKHISQMENHIQWAVQWTVSPTTSRLQMHVFAGMRQPGSIYPSMKAKGIIVKCDLREARAIRNQDFLTCLLYLNGIILLVF